MYQLINKMDFEAIRFRGLLVVGWALFGAFVATYLLYWYSVGGDASIYLPYAKWMFHSPFSYGVRGNIAYGASSPLWALFISVFYSPSDTVYLYSLKVANLALFLGSIVILTKSLKVPFLPLFFLITVNVSGVFEFFLLYENALILFWIALVVHCICKNDVRRLLWVTAFLPLVRGEFVFIQVACLYAFRREIHIKHLLWQCVPFGLYAGYMFFNTDSLIPSSVLTQILKNRLASLERTDRHWILQILANLFNNPYALAYLIFLTVAGLCKVPRMEKLFSVCFWSLLAMFLVAILLQPSLRYSSEFFSLGSIACAVYLHHFLAKNRLPDSSLVFSAVIVIMFFTWTNLFFQEFKARKENSEGLASTWYSRTVPDMANILNQVMLPDDKVLIYEIQGQYHLNQRAVSMDGVVGGQATPYLLMGIKAGKPTMDASYADFIEQHQYLVLGHGTGGTLFKGTAYDFLNDTCETLNVGDHCRYGSLIFTKIAQNPRWTTKGQKIDETWRSIFKIDHASQTAD